MSTDPLLGAPIAGPGGGSSLSGPGVTAPSLNPAQAAASSATSSWSSGS